jgi:hypothetical protein
MKQRQVNISLTQSDIIGIAESIGSWEKMWEAIGYLSTWAADAYSEVTIFRDRTADIMASYKSPSTGNRYVINAVWHGDHYGFHS